MAALRLHHAADEHEVAELRHQSRISSATDAAPPLRQRLEERPHRVRGAPLAPDHAPAVGGGDLELDHGPAVLDVLVHAHAAGLAHEPAGEVGDEPLHR